MTSAGGWDNLRKHARALETALDSKLTSYSKLASTISRSGGARDELVMEEEGVGGYKLVEEEVQELLDKLSQTIDGLSAKLNDPNETPSTSMLHAAQRHREVLQDYNRDFKQTKSNVEHALNSQNLLGSVRKDINAFKASRSDTADALLAERSRIDSSHAMTDNVLDQAYATRADFANQRSTLNNVNSRMGSTLNVLPGMNTLISLIQSRRRRDTIIIGCLCGSLTVLLLMYMSR